MFCLYWAIVHCGHSWFHQHQLLIFQKAHACMPTNQTCPLKVNSYGASWLLFSRLSAVVAHTTHCKWGLVHCIRVVVHCCCFLFVFAINTWFCWSMVGSDSIISYRLVLPQDYYSLPIPSVNINVYFRPTRDSIVICDQIPV